MELITVLNRCHHFQGFVYQHAGFSPNHKSIEGSYASVRAPLRYVGTLPKSEWRGAHYAEEIGRAAVFAGARLSLTLR
jgi:hypothetical protein